MKVYFKTEKEIPSANSLMKDSSMNKRIRRF